MSHIAPPATLPPGSRVCCYLRDSGGESQEQSTGQQRREIESFCEANTLTLARVFEDAAKSGGSTKKREQFQEMVSYCTGEDRPQGLLVWNYARFSRDMDDSTFYRAMLRKSGVVIHSLTDPIPPGDFSRVVETLIDYANEEKRRQTSRDVKRALAERTRAGYSQGGPAPRGYRVTREEIGTRRNGLPRMGTRLEPDPELGPLATLAFQMRAEGKSLAEIVEATQGKLYKNKNCFCTFFANRTYLGIGRCGDLEIENHHPALVDKATWDAVKRIQQDARHNKAGNLLHPKRINVPSLLSGLAVCIHCGTPVIRDSTGKGRWKSYLCGMKRRVTNYRVCEGRQVDMVKADQAVIDTVLTRILTPDFVNELLEELRAQVSDTAQIDRLEAEARQDLAVCEKAIGRLLTTIEETDSPAAKARLKEREAEKAQMETKITSFQAKKDAAKFTVSPEALKLVLAVWAGEIEEAHRENDIRNLQSLLRRFVTKVELGYNQAKIWYTYPIERLGDVRKSTEKWSGPL